jgi:hypothetical protein
MGGKGRMRRKRGQANVKEGWINMGNEGMVNGVIERKEGGREVDRGVGGGEKCGGWKEGNGLRV